MKILNIIAVLAVIISTSVSAGDHTLNVVARTGWIYKDNDVEKTGVLNSSSFNIDYLRTTFSGVISPTVKYFFVADLLGDTNNDTVDGTGTLIDEAYLTKTFTFGTSISLGKKAVLIGGREYDYLIHDIYSGSAFYNATPANQAGITLSQEMMGQTFLAQYFNGNKENGHANTNAQSKFGYAGAWYGSFLNGMIKPIVGYSVVPETKEASSSSGTRDNSGNDKYFSAGIQFNTPHNIVLELDYDTLTEKNAEVGNANLETISKVGLIRYTGEKMSPFVKIISDEIAISSVKTGSKLTYDLGVEFVENPEDMVRYHIVYSGAKEKSNMNTNEIKSSPSSIFLGLKFDAAILK